MFLIGFLELPSPDEQELIKRGFFAMWLIQSLHLYSSTGKLSFADGVTISRQQLELLYGVELTLKIHDTMASLNYLYLTDIEISLMMALALLVDGKQS